MNGTFVTSDVLTFDCLLSYQTAFKDSFSVVVILINNDLDGGTLCPYTRGTSVLASDTVFNGNANTVRLDLVVCKVVAATIADAVLSVRHTSL